MQLIICEKPKVAQKIADALAEGKVEMNRAHGIAYYKIKRGKEEIYLAPAVGHVYSLEQSSGARSEYPVFDIEWKKAYEVEKDADYTKGYIDVLEELGQKADEIIVACDYDIEGSLIGYNVLRFACKAKTGARMKFSALTTEDLVEAYEERGELDVLNAKAGEARHMLDWFWGINLSRALMDAIKKSGTFKVMSIGRVQGPALSILAKREKGIIAFKPTPYWEVGFDSKGAPFLHEKERFAKKDEAKAAFDATGKTGKVEEIETREYLQNPPFPFDLTSLQVEAHACIGMDPKRTLEVAQSLYEASLISYPRTSSQKLPAKLKLPGIIERIAKNPKYEALAKKLIADKRFVPNEGKKEDPAHPAIYPTGLEPRSFGAQEDRLYDLIVRRFLSTFAVPAKRESQRIKVISGWQGYLAGGNRTVFEGWFEIYKPYLKLDEITLPPFAKGEEVGIENLKVTEKKTKPPRRYTPASIISDLEKVGLGTKATRATIVDTLFKRGYLEGKQIKVTAFGLSVYDNLSGNVPEIMDEDMTRNLEDEMEKIQSGEIPAEKVIADGRKLLEEAITHLLSVQVEVGRALSEGLVEKRVADSLLGKCPKCGKDLRMIVSRANKKFVGCSGYPACTNTYPLPQNGKIESLGSVCEKCGTPQIKVIRAKRRPFMMCIDPTCETKKDWGKPNPNWKKKEEAAPKKADSQPVETPKSTPSDGLKMEKPPKAAPKRVAKKPKKQETKN